MFQIGKTALIRVAIVAVIAASPQAYGQDRKPPTVKPPVNQRGPEVKIAESYNTGSTGYLMAMTQLSDGIHVVITEDKGPAQPIPGAPSQRTFTLLASKPQSEVTLSHFQPWTPGSMNSVKQPIKVELTAPISKGNVETRTIHVKPNAPFEIKISEYPQYLMLLQSMSDGIYFLTTEHEDAAEPIPGAHGSRIFHMYAGREFKSGKMTINYHVPGNASEGSTVEYIVRTAGANYDRLGVTCQPAAGGQGIEIVDVANGSAADDYRLRAGDVILSVNAEDTNSVDSYLKLLKQPGPFFHVRGRYKNGKPFEFTCNLAPPAAAEGQQQQQQ